MSTIAAMQEKITEQECQIEENERIIAEETAQNKKDTKSLKRMTNELQKLKEISGPCEKDKAAMEAACKKLKLYSRELEGLKCSFLKLETNYQNGIKEKIDLEQRSNAAICSVHKTLSLKIQFLEKKISFLEVRHKDKLPKIV